MRNPKRFIKRLWLKLLIGFYYKDPRASRALLIGASLAWAAWLFTPGDSLREATALRVIAVIFPYEWTVASVPMSIAAFQGFVTFPRFNRLRLIADFTSSAWWVFLSITYFLSNPFAPSIGVYLTLTVFSLWIVWRDTDPKLSPLIDTNAQE